MTPNPRANSEMNENVTENSDSIMSDHTCPICGEEANAKDPVDVPRDEYGGNVEVHRDRENDVQYVHYKS